MFILFLFCNLLMSSISRVQTIIVRQDLTAENECLRRAFEQAEEKLRKLSQEKLNWQNAIGKTTEPATTKLIELGKKYRNQTAEMETLKTKCKNLEATLLIKDSELERQRAELQQILKSETYKNSGDSEFVFSSLLQAIWINCNLEINLNYTNQKLFEKVF